MIGYRTATVEYERGERFSGESKYPLKKMLAFAMEGITSLSTKPLKMITGLGFFIFLVSIAMLTGIAYIVMLLSKLMPSVMFLDFDFKDVVVCIGGFTFGPFAAAIISILVAFIEMLTISHTGPIGFIMNVLATCAFSCTACFIYKKVHSKKGAVLGLPAAWRAWSR